MSSQVRVPSFAAGLSVDGVPGLQGVDGVVVSAARPERLTASPAYPREQSLGVRVLPRVLPASQGGGSNSIPYAFRRFKATDLMKMKFAGKPEWYHLFEDKVGAAG